MQNQPKLTAALLRPQARGRWLEIFQNLCPGMFDEAIHKLGTHVTCPFHGGENDFRLVKRAKKGHENTAEVGVAMCTCGVYSDGFSVIQKALGIPFIEVLKRINEHLNGSVSVSAPVRKYVPVLAPEASLESDAEILKKVNSLWDNGKTLNLKETAYYVERGIDPSILEDLQDVRTMASLGYFHKVGSEIKKLGSFPAILALMRDVLGNPVAVHRTWLSKDRKEKAAVPKAKKLSASPGVRGAAMRLFAVKNSDVLGLSEGVETALAVRQLSRGRYWKGLGPVPVWACFAERNIRNFQIPEEMLATLKKIIVFADNDENGTGMAAAVDFKKRMAVEHPHLIVEIYMPEVVGWDWLDVLVNL